MLQVQFIVENKETVLKGLAKRNLKNASQKINSIIELDKTRKETQSELDNILSETNKLSKEIGMFFKSGESAKANTLKAKVATLKEESKKLRAKIKQNKSNYSWKLYECETEECKVKLVKQFLKQLFTLIVLDLKYLLNKEASSYII